MKPRKGFRKSQVPIYATMMRNVFAVNGALLRGHYVNGKIVLQKNTFKNRMIILAKILGHAVFIRPFKGAQIVSYKSERAASNK